MTSESQPPTLTWPEGPTGITHARPDWMRQGLVVAGNWSSVTARHQRISASWTQMGHGLSDADAATAYARELSPEMADRLQSAGATLVILPLWSGMGAFEEERIYFEDTRQFADLLRARGLRVGVYLHDMNLSKGFLDARPEAYDWLAWSAPDTPFDKPPPPETESEGYPVYRNHPGYLAFLFSVIRAAIQDIGADFLHFDNFVNYTGYGPRAVEDFVAFLRRRHTPETLRELGVEHPARLAEQAHTDRPPVSYEWKLFQAWSLAECYRQLTDHARRLNPRVATDANACGMDVSMRAPVDLSLLVPHGDAFWDEHARIAWEPDARILASGVRSYKIARLFSQSALLYSAPGRALCQAMAFNNDTLGCLYGFMYARLRYGWAGEDANGVPPDEVRFYLAQRQLYADGVMLADAALWRGRAVTVYGPPTARQHAYLFEQALITRHIPFAIVFDQHLAVADQYRALIVPDVCMMTDDQCARLCTYVADGGALVITDDTARYDAWGRERPERLALLFGGAGRPEPGRIYAYGKGRTIYVSVQSPDPFVDGCRPLNEEALADACLAVMGPPTVRTTAPAWIGMETVHGVGQLIVHLFDFSDAPRTAPFTLTVDGTRVPSVAAATLYSPYAEPRALPVQAETSATTLLVPSFFRYAVVRLATCGAHLPAPGARTVARPVC